jgi:hypothetical protein
VKIKPIIIGLVAALLLPLAGANARAVLDPGLIRAGEGADLERGVVSTNENLGRAENGRNGNKGSKGKGSKGSKGSKSPSKPPKGSKGKGSKKK